MHPESRMRRVRNHRARPDLFAMEVASLQGDLQMLPDGLHQAYSSDTSSDILCGPMSEGTV